MTSTLLLAFLLQGVQPEAAEPSAPKPASPEQALMFQKQIVVDGEAQGALP